MTSEERNNPINQSFTIWYRALESLDHIVVAITDFLYRYLSILFLYTEIVVNLHTLRKEVFLRNLYDNIDDYKLASHTLLITLFFLSRYRFEKFREYYYEEF